MGTIYVAKEPRKKQLVSQLNPIKSQWYSISEQLEGSMRYL